MTLAQQLELSCDINLNTVCDVADLDLLLSKVPAGEPGSDLNGDRAVDFNDVDFWLTSAGHENIQRPYLRGDATLDGVVDAGDLNVLAINWNSAVNSWAHGDFNGDGRVNPNDLNILAKNWADEGPTQTVPEPSGAASALAAAAVAMWWKQRGQVQLLTVWAGLVDYRYAQNRRGRAVWQFADSSTWNGRASGAALRLASSSSTKMVTVRE